VYDVGAALDVDDLVLRRKRHAIDPLALLLVLGGIAGKDLSDAHARRRHCRIRRLAQLTIAVYSGRADLHDALRERCPGFTFATEGPARDGCRVALLDDDAAEAEPRKAVARVILGEATPQRKQGELFIARDAFLAAPASYLAFAIDLAEAAIHASHLEVEVGYLTQIAELMAMTDASAVSERITRTVLNLLGLAHGTLFIHDPRLERYVVSFTNDGGVRDTGEFLPGIPQGLLQRALSSGESFAADAEAGMIVIPLQVEDDLVGVIKLPIAPGDSVDAEATANVSRYIGAVASVLGNIYQLTRSQDLAMRDDLTKAFNRRFFESYLDEEIERSRRYGSLFSIIFLDLDELKNVNDFYGHLTGSRTLQEVAKRILAAVRGIDKVVRFGGDEFCIILPQTDQEQAVAVANRVRKAMISSAYHLEPNIDISITASFGIATYPTHAIAKDDLVRQADLAMYRVKSTTKNAIGVATVEPAATRPATL
jgi:diguanylate cyclase (GGDEF)-like protein